MALGQRIKERREQLGMGQTQLCERVNSRLKAGETELSQQALAALEKRDSAASAFAVRIADALAVSVRWLCDGDGQPGAREWPFTRRRRLLGSGLRPELARQPSPPTKPT